MKPEQRILELMTATGKPLVISGVTVHRWFHAMPSGRPQVGVWPTLSEKPSAYQAEVAGRRVSIRAALHLLRTRQVRPRRNWRIRAYCDLAKEASP
jgi:hypothetical protein